MTPNLNQLPKVEYIFGNIMKRSKQKENRSCFYGERDSRIISIKARQTDQLTFLWIRWGL